MHPIQNLEKLSCFKSHDIGSSLAFVKNLKVKTEAFINEGFLSGFFQRIPRSRKLNIVANYCANVPNFLKNHN